MTRVLPRIAAAALVGASILAAEADHAHGYFVRPFIQVNGGALIDGIEENGATSAGQNFGSDFQAEVDLEQGTVGALLNIPTSMQSGVVGGSFGERVTFDNAAGTTVDFSFFYDGEISVSDLLPGPLPTGLSISLFANLFVYDASAGATFDNFTTLGGALISESVFDNSFGTPSGGTPTQTEWSIDDALSGSLVIGAENQFDVFAALSIAIATNNNDVEVLMDFLNTGTFGIDTEPGVSYTSGSGVFLDSTGVTPTPVPVPAALPLFAGGLGFLGLLGWRRRRSTSA